MHKSSRERPSNRGLSQGSQEASEEDEESSPLDETSHQSPIPENEAPATDSATPIPSLSPAKEAISSSSHQTQLVTETLSVPSPNLSFFFAEVASALGSLAEQQSSSTASSTDILSSDTISKAKAQLKKLLAMEFLVHSERVKEANEAVKVLDKGKSLLSPDQRACLPQLMKVEEWCKNYQEGEKEAAEAKEVLALREDLREQLQKKVLNDYKVASRESEAATKEKKKTNESLADVRLQIAKLQAEEKFLSEKAGAQKETLARLSKTQQELFGTAQPLMATFRSQDEHVLKAGLSAAEQKIAEMVEAFKDLQAHFLPSPP